jgi:hypothetical protein
LRHDTIRKTIFISAMENKIWKAIGFWALALILLIATMIIIRWVIDFVTWSALDSGWAQAAGSFIALGVAIHIMRSQNANATRLMLQQNAHTTKLMLNSDIRATRRYASAVGSIVTRANTKIRNAALDVIDSIEKSSDQALPHHAARHKHALVETREALTAIPAHELGDFDLVEGLLQTVECMNRLHATLESMANGVARDAIKSWANEIVADVDTASAQFQKGVDSLKVDN